VNDLTAMSQESCNGWDITEEIEGAPIDTIKRCIQDMIHFLFCLKTRIL
jgi:hypothetical protein